MDDDDDGGGGQIRTSQGCKTALACDDNLSNDHIDENAKCPHCTIASREMLETI